MGRFTGVDPISDKFAHLSTYNYAGNNPISCFDLWGLQPVWAFEAGPLLERMSVDAGVYEYDGTFPSMQNAVQYSDRPEKQAQIDAYTTAGVGGLMLIGGEMLMAAKPVKHLIGKAKGAIKDLLKSGDEAANVARDSKSASNAIKLEKQLASEAQMAEDGTIIAGGNTGKELRKASGLADEYGGSANDYVKKTSTSHTASDGTKIQTHWEENTRTGDRFNLKTKIEQVVKKWTSND